MIKPMKKLLLASMLLANWTAMYAVTEIVQHDGVEYIVEVANPSVTAIATKILDPQKTTIELPTKFRSSEGVMNNSIVEVIDFVPDLFQNNETVETIILSAYIKKIPEKAFYGCTSLKEVYTSGTENKSIDNEQIGNQAFAYCHSLERLNIGYHVSTIYGDIFAGDAEEESVPQYPNLKEITIEPGVELTLRSPINSTRGIPTKEGVADRTNVYGIHLDTFNIERDIDYILTNTLPQIQAETVNINYPQIPSFLRRSGIAATNVYLNDAGITSVELIQLSYFPDLENLYCFTLTPPTFSNNSDYHQSIYENVNLYVPKVSRRLYASTPGWRRFKNIYPLDTEGIGKIPPYMLEGTYKAETYRLDESGEKVDYVTKQVYIGCGFYSNNTGRLEEGNTISDPLGHDGYLPFTVALESNNYNFAVKNKFLQKIENPAEYGRDWTEIQFSLQGDMCLTFDNDENPVIHINDWSYAHQFFHRGLEDSVTYTNEHSYTVLTYLNNSSVDNIIEDSTEGEEVWYDLSGKIVQKRDIMPSGIYIVAKGSTRTKVLIK